MVKVLFLCQKGGGYSKTYRGKPGLSLQQALPDYIKKLITGQKGMHIFHLVNQPDGMCVFLSGFLKEITDAHFLSHQKRRLDNMRKEQVILTTDNKQMEEKGMKQKLRGFKKKLIPAVSGAAMSVMLMSTTCFAAGTDTSAITQPLDNLKTLVIAIIGAVGVIILAKNVMEFAQAYQQQDSSTMNSALKGIVAGVMMAGISTVLTFLGF